MRYIIPVAIILLLIGGCRNHDKPLPSKKVVRRSAPNVIPFDYWFLTCSEIPMLELKLSNIRTNKILYNKHKKLRGFLLNKKYGIIHYYLNSWGEDKSGIGSEMIEVMGKRFTLDSSVLTGDEYIDFQSAWLVGFEKLLILGCNIRKYGGRVPDWRLWLVFDLRDKSHIREMSLFDNGDPTDISCFADCNCDGLVDFVRLQDEDTVFDVYNYNGRQFVKDPLHFVSVGFSKTQLDVQSRGIGVPADLIYPAKSKWYFPIVAESKLPKVTVRREDYLHNDSMRRR
jgi:hypothetical protein